MGGGIAQVCAQSGYPVLVSEISDDLLRKGLASIKSSLDRSVQKERITELDRDTAIDLIRGTTDTGEFGECDLVIEAAVEDLDLKKRIFKKLDGICPEHAILASNTSSLLIGDIAAVTGRKEKVLGMHFFNPVPVMKLVELVRAAATSEETFNAGQEFCRSLGKTVVTARDSPGFVVNRLMTTQILGAIHLLESGTATKEDIDSAMTLGLNHPMGPLALADLIGLDTLLEIAENIYNKLKDKQYTAPALLRRMVADGKLGRKTGGGFYEY